MTLQLPLTPGVIIQVVNLKGYGAGLSGALDTTFPGLKKHYRSVVGDKGLGDISVFSSGQWHIINLYAMERYRLSSDPPGLVYVDYQAFRDAYAQAIDWRNENAPSAPIYVPYKIACVRGGGDWKIIEELMYSIYPKYTLWHPKSQND